DDLTTRGATEPYRMFTSRAEFRLSLRADNADQRLTPIGIMAGCVGETRQAAFDMKMEKLTAARDRLERISFTPKQLSEIGLKMNQDGSRRTGFQLLSFPDLGFDDLEKLDSSLQDIDEETRAQIAKDALYANYIERQQREVDILKRDEALVIDPDFDFNEVNGLSNELKSKLTTTRPSNIAQAGRIDGMTPAALTIILAKLRSTKRERRA
ncbi:MAG: tRNA uridine-5-carboxymethylaminomethyl(34) synthesis enzyme MnmG, partial [Pseudomonadota bacterium]